MRRTHAPLAVVLALSAALAPASARAAATPYTSWRKLVTTNGFAPVVYDLEARRVTSFREHLYRNPAPGVTTKELAYDLYLGLRVNGASGWLTDTTLTDAGYERGTGLIRTVQDARGVRVTTTYTSPFRLNLAALLVHATVENTGADTTDVALFSLHNFHVGGGAGTTGEHVTWDASIGAFLESSTARGAPAGVLIIKPIGAIAHHAATPANPFTAVQSSQLLADVDDSGVIDDAVSGFQFDVAGRGAFARGAKASIAFVVAWAPDGDARAAAAKIDTFVSGQGADDVLESERLGWRAWHAAGVWPVTRSDDEAKVAEQAVALLRMGQVREPGSPNGQSVASLPPGHWDIAWLRDGLFAVEALTKMGHHDEAEAALEFMKRGPFGDYQMYVGRAYGLSLTRYFGNAKEESDSNQNGPNIELDGFGMYLEEAARHVREGGRDAWFAANRAYVDGLVADVLVAYRDAETKMIADDSSIWETHWTGSGRQRWAYTSGRAVRGLLDWAAEIERHAGASDPKVAEYRTAAMEIDQGMRAALTDPASGALASSVEQLAGALGHFADVQTAFIMRPDLIDPASMLGLATLDFLKSRLFLAATTGHGYKRNDDGGSYDEREWVVADLLIARALRDAGRVDEADALIDWVTGMATANFLLVPELLDETSAAYVGEIPMVGFGAGAYVLTLAHRSGTTPPPSAVNDAGTRIDAGPSSGDSGGPDLGVVADAGSGVDANVPEDAAGASDAATVAAQKEGCSCAETEGRRTHVWTVALLLVALSTRRRSRRG